jgi:ribosomal protein L11 methyltransferase
VAGAGTGSAAGSAGTGALAGITWLEISLEVPTPAAEVLADAVGSLTGGVEVRDAETIIRTVTGRSVIVAQCSPEIETDVLAEVEETCARLRAAGISPDPLTMHRREAHEDEWRDVWKQHFRALRVGRRFLVRPSWDEQPARPGDMVIDIDPGRAFGTGGHASTRLVIAMAEEIAEKSLVAKVERYLDLGCGSGILSMAAAQLWPTAQGLALDVDSEAVATTLENFARNRTTSVDARVGTLADAGELPYDVVLANIEAVVLIPLAPAFPARIAPGGKLIVSGLLATDVPGVEAAYVAAGFTPEARRDEGEWAALRFGRSGR